MMNVRTSILNHRTVMMSATIVALLPALCFAIYSSTINGYFLADDFGYVQLYYRKNLSSLTTVLAADWLHRANKQWREAGQLSARMRDEIPSLLKDAPAGSGLIFYLPGQLGKAWVWAWASPFVFRQPFSNAQLDERYKILESPGLYCCAWDQYRLPLMRQLSEQPKDSYLFFVGAGNHLVKKKVPPERLRARLSEILAGANWDKTWQAEINIASP